MSDNKTFQATTLATLPNATVVATDEIAGVDYQKVKLTDGTADSTTMILSGNGVAAGALRVTIASDSTGVIGVTGTFWQATQPVSGPLTDTQLRASAVPISASSLPLPTGAATLAKQPALGTAGTASADVITVQGITSMTALKVDGSGVTQPVSGTFWQATQPVSGPLTDTQLRATAVPVSGTVALSNPVTQYTEDAVAPGDPVGNSKSLVQVASPADRGAAAGDWVSQTGTKYGAANVQLVTSTGSFIDSVGGGSQYAEDAAHVSGDIGTVALAVRTDVPVQRAGTDGDYAVLETDADGKLWVNAGTIRARKNPTSAVLTLTATTTETTLIAAVASEYHDLYSLVLTNTGTSSTKVTLRDDTTTGVARIFYVPAFSTVGLTLGIADAIPQTAQNKPWTLQCGTITSSLEAFALYVKVT